MSEYRIIPMERRVDVQVVTAGRHAGFREFPSVAAAQAWIDAQSDKEGNAVGADTQVCRDCGVLFPYSEDADRCAVCVAAMIPSALEGTAVPSSEQEAERFAVECEDAQPLQTTLDAAEQMAARAAFYWALAANWEGS